MKLKMKRFLGILLSLVMVLGMLPSLAAYAADVTINFSEQGYLNGATVDSVSNGEVTVTFDKGTGSNPPKYYDSGTAVRLYYGNTMTVAASAPITSITITFSSSETSSTNGNEITVDTGSFDGSVWTGNASQVTFTVQGAKGHRRIQALTVSLEAWSPSTIDVENVTLSPDTDQTLNIGEYAAFTATVSPDYATDKTVIWSVGGTNADAVILYADENCTTEIGTDATEILTVYAKGVSTGDATVIVTATNGTDDTADDMSASCNVTINKADAVPATVTANNRTCDGTEEPLVTVDDSALAGGDMWYALGENATTAPADDLYTTSIPAATSVGTYYVWYKVVGDTNHNNTAPVCVTVAIESSLTITTQPENAEAFNKTPVTFSISADGDDITYQWQYRKNDSQTWIDSGLASATTDTFSFKATVKYNGYQFRCKLMDIYGTEVDSEIATLTINGPFSIIKQPSDVEVVNGKKATFKVRAIGSGITYQWQYRKNDSKTWIDSGLASATTDTFYFKPTAKYNGYQFRCKLTDENNEDLYSDIVTLTIGGPLDIVTQPKDVEVATGERATFKLAAVGSGITYQWQYSKNGGEDWINVNATGADTNTVYFRTKANYNGYKFRCVLTVANNDPVISDVVTLTVG